MEILNQLGGLLLGAMPTAFFFVLVVIAYHVLVRGPLERTLGERRSRTSGAMDQARDAIAAAESETAAYEARLRTARAEILAARESRLKQWQSEKDAALAAARHTAHERVRSAKAEIEEQATGAREQIAGSVVPLGESIVRALLPHSGVVSAEVRQ